MAASKALAASVGLNTGNASTSYVDHDTSSAGHGTNSSMYSSTAPVAVSCDTPDPVTASLTASDSNSVLVAVVQVSSDSANVEASKNHEDNASNDSNIAAAPALRNSPEKFLLLKSSHHRALDATKATPM